MTYCIGMRLNQGMVFLADSRTNAGVDQIGTFRKMTVFERPGERMMALLTSGNLGVTQSVRQLVMEQASVWEATTMYEAATRVGEAVRTVYERDAKHLQELGIEFNCNLIFGGQIGNERCRLFQIYAAGNFIEAQDENLYFQVGESKYGKPIIDRVVTPETTLDEAAKCALISMDSTLRSNLSVGMPLDLLCYETGSLRVTRFVTIEADNAYFQVIRKTWGQQLRHAFSELPDPTWHAREEGVKPSAPVRAPSPGAERVKTSSMQSFAQSPTSNPGGPKG